VFSYPGQDRNAIRALTVYVRAPAGIAARPFSLDSNTGTVAGSAGSNEVTANVSVCVPRGGFSEVRLSAKDTSPVYGDPSSEVTVAQPRTAGVLVTRIYLSGRIGAACKP
jgi:hypothetical protein